MKELKIKDFVFKYDNSDERFFHPRLIGLMMANIIDVESSPRLENHMKCLNDVFRNEITSTAKIF